MPETQLLLADDHLVLIFPYDKDQVDEIKRIKNSKWDKIAKVWRVPMTSLNEARDFAAKHGIAFADTPEALLAHPEVDIVCLCTPSGDHLAPALACAKASKHVVVEKPLEVTLARCDELTTACAKAGVTVAGILPRRFGAGAVALKAALEAGRFGKLTLAGALIPWWRTQAYYDSAAWRGTFALDGGGAVMNQGIHTVDLLLWLLGAPKRVSATAGLVAHDGIEVEDIAAGWIEFANGCRATLASSTACLVFPGPRRWITSAL